MAFKIHFVEDNSIEGFVRDSSRVGEIVIDDFHELFITPTDYWNEAQYINHWKQAVKDVLASDLSTSALMVSMHNPESAEFITCWPLYRENDTVYIQNRLIFTEDIKETFNAENIQNYIGKREKFNEDGDEISEWSTQVVELEEWIKEI